MEVVPHEAAAKLAASAAGRIPTIPSPLGLGFKGPAVEDDRHWQFLLLQPTTRHVTSCCYSSTQQGGEEAVAPTQLRMWETVPLRWDREMDGSNGELFLGCSVSGL